MEATADRVPRIGSATNLLNFSVPFLVPGGTSFVPPYYSASVAIVMPGGHHHPLYRSSAPSGPSFVDHGRLLSEFDDYGKNTKHTTGGIPRWSPTLVLVARFSAYVWQSGRDAQFSLTYGRMYHEICLFEIYPYFW